MADAITPPSVAHETSERRRWWYSRAPERLPTPGIAKAVATSTAALILLVAVGTWTGQTLLVPPLAASMALLTGARTSPLGQPRNVIGGHLICAAISFAVLALGWHGPWATAVAGGLSLGPMLLLRAAHPPSAATAVIVVTTGPPAGKFLLLLAVATALLVVVGIVASRLQKQTYPAYWW